MRGAQARPQPLGRDRRLRGRRAGRLPARGGRRRADRGLGVDYLKYDWCSIPTADVPGQNVQQIAQTLYPPMRAALGDSVAFAMNNEDGSTVPWLWGRELATTWRTNLVTSPLADSYPGMVTAWENNMLRQEYAGPGSWNDPDLLQIGQGGMTDSTGRSSASGP
ncbi:hypothetical protein Misp01_29020 [Microtetraspora sp. NBRC 13810]|uniref:hypothetical protein n=1 Tax=Microtetraspora sp. NBRC 13810 TaxID=3030990 RepID=UPI0024A38879|nr:hypothetical protein [Microtetraspora sp. NBRC 13810]GLW07772.1 hypothetical protein Misp01_29020 [Microtetraspora sp. NBRC 13810]